MVVIDPIVSPHVVVGLIPPISFFDSQTDSTEEPEYHHFLLIKSRTFYPGPVYLSTLYSDKRGKAVLPAFSLYVSSVNPGLDNSVDKFGWCPSK